MKKDVRLAMFLFSMWGIMLLLGMWNHWDMTIGGLPGVPPIHIHK